MLRAYNSAIQQPQGKATAQYQPYKQSSVALTGQTEGKLVRGTLAQFKRNMKKFWTANLLVRQSAGEVVGLCAKPKNARQVLGLDIYEMQLLCSHFHMNFVFELYEVFVSRRDEIAKFMDNCFHPRQQATLFAQLERTKDAIRSDLGFSRALKRAENQFVIKRRSEQEAKQAALQNAANGSQSLEDKLRSTTANIIKSQQKQRHSSTKVPKKNRSQKTAQQIAQDSQANSGGKASVDKSRTSRRRKNESVGPGLGLAAPTPVKNTDNLPKPKYNGNISSNKLDYSADPEAEDAGMVRLPMILPLNPSKPTPMRMSGTDKRDEAWPQKPDSRNGKIRRPKNDIPRNKSASSNEDVTDGTNLKPKKMRNKPHDESSSAQITKQNSELPTENKTTNLPDPKSSEKDPQTYDTQIDNLDVAVPESNLDVYLRESETKPDEDSVEAFRKWSTSKYRAVDLTEYFVHPEIDKHAELDLNHFGLGEDETNMLYGYLQDNQQIKAVCLQDNRIGPRCATYLSKTISNSSVLTKLDLSNNCLGNGTVILAHALKDTRSLTWLSLRDNKIAKAAKQLAEGLRHNRSLRALDLSYNDIDDEGGYCIARAIQDNTHLKELNLNWNSMGPFSGEALGQVLKFNATLMSLSVAWNNLRCEGTIGIAEGLAQNSSLQFLDLSSNRVDYPAVTLFADALSINSHLKNLQINNNPLGTSGIHLLFAASEANLALKHIGLNRVSAPPHTQRISQELHFFDSSRLSGHYILNLEVRWDHTIAELLRIRVMKEMGQMFRFQYDGEQTTIDPCVYVVPLTGEVSFDYISGEMLKRIDQSSSGYQSMPQSVHYTLDLTRADDREVYTNLCSQARSQEGENFINETLNGQPFQFDEDAKKDPSEELHSGIIELDFVTTRLSHEARYQFDLRKPQHHAKATKMLERVYLSVRKNSGVGGLSKIDEDANEDDMKKGNAQSDLADETASANDEMYDRIGKDNADQGQMFGSASGDRWTNVTVDGKPVNVHEWRVNVDAVGTFKWREEIDQKDMANTLRETWRVPTQGILEFDLVTSNPMYIFSDHYKLNLANVRDRQLAESLRVSAALQPGENWWNETLNGYRFDLNEVVGGGGRLPNRGILEFDIVMLAPQRGTLQMKQDHYIFDLEDPQEFECASLMRKRIMKYRLSQEEFWMHVRLNDQIIPASMVWRAMWQIPTQGVLEFDYVTFDSERRDMPRNTFKLLTTALKAVNDREKFYMLQSQVAGIDPYHMTINQIRKLLNLFPKGAVEQRMALEVLLGMLRHPHHALHLLQTVANRDHNALKYWALHAKWMI